MNAPTIGKALVRINLRASIRKRAAKCKTALLHPIDTGRGIVDARGLAPVLDRDANARVVFDKIASAAEEAGIATKQPCRAVRRVAGTCVKEVSGFALARGATALELLSRGGVGGARCKCCALVLGHCAAAVGTGRRKRRVGAHLLRGDAT